jgi:hypothetical protein
VSVKRRWKIVIAAVAIIAVVATIALTTRDSEPEYKGRTLSEWASELNQFGLQRVQAGDNDLETIIASPPAAALREMTPQILPILIRWISYEKSPRRERVENFFWPVANRVGASRRYALLTFREEMRSARAQMIFCVLGTNAVPALPQLSNVVVNASKPKTAEDALRAIEFTGKAGIKTMLGLALNPRNHHQTETMSALGQCRFKGYDKLITTELRKYMNDSDPNVRGNATNAFNQLH